MVPFGFRFNPTDEELIQILERKVFHSSCHLDFIVERNVYEHEPQHLEWDQTVAVNNGEKYYFCRRENDSREVTGRGWWKATSHVKTIYGGGRVVGYKRPLTFHKFKDAGRKRNSSIKTDWIMHEYSLEFDATEWRLCKIKYKGKEGIHQEENLATENSGNSSNQPSSSGAAAGNSRQLEFAGTWQQQQPQPPQQHDVFHEPNFWPVINNADQPPQYNPSIEALISSDYPLSQHFLDSIQQPFPDLWD